MVLGDNVFFGHNLTEPSSEAEAQPTSGTIFSYKVSDPERYGVVSFDKHGQAVSIVEKPAQPVSHYAVTGLCFLDGGVPERAPTVKLSGPGVS